MKHIQVKALYFNVFFVTGNDIFIMHVSKNDAGITCDK